MTTLGYLPNCQNRQINWLPTPHTNLCNSTFFIPTYRGYGSCLPMLQIHVSLVGPFHYQKISVQHLNAQFPCTDNDKYGLTYKLTYRICLLTVTSWYVDWRYYSYISACQRLCGEPTFSFGNLKNGKLSNDLTRHIRQKWFCSSPKHSKCDT